MRLKENEPLGRPCVSRVLPKSQPLSQKVLGEHNDGLAAEFTKLLRSYEQLQQTKERLQDELRLKSEECQRWKSQSDRLTAMAKLGQHCELQSTRESFKAGGLHDQNCRLMAELAETRLLTHSLEKEVEHALQVNQSVTQQNTELRAGVQDLRSVLSEFESANKVLLESNGQLRAQVEAVLGKSELIIEEKQFYSRKCEQVGAQIASLYQKASLIQHQFGVLEEENRQLSAANEELRSELRTTASKPLPLPEMVYVTLPSNQAALRAKLGQAFEEVARLGEDLSDLSRENQSLRELVRSLEQQRKVMKQALAAGEQQMTEREKQIKEQIREQSRKLQQAISEKDRLTNRMRKQSEETQRELQGKTEQIQALRLELSEVGTSAQLATARLQEELTEARKQGQKCRQLERKVKEQTSEVAKLRRQAEGKERQAKNCKEQLEQRLSQLEQLKQQLRQTKRQLEDLTERSTRLQQEKQAIEKDNARNGDESVRRTKELAKRTAEQERELSRLKAICERREREIVEQKEELLAAVKEARAEAEQLSRLLQQAFERQKELTQKLEQTNLRKRIQSRAQQTVSKADCWQCSKLAEKVEQLNHQLTESQQRQDELTRDKDGLLRERGELNMRVQSLIEECLKVGKQVDQLSKKGEKESEQHGRVAREQAAEIAQLKARLQKPRVVKSRVKGDDKILTEFEGKINDMMKEVKRAKGS